MSFCVVYLVDFDFDPIPSFRFVMLGLRLYVSEARAGNDGR